MNGYVHIKICPVCDSKLSSISLEKGLWSNMVVTMGDIPLRSTTFSSYKICLECGTAYQSPRLTDELIEKFYSAGVYREISQMYVNQDMGEMNRADSDAKKIHELFPDGIKSHLDIGCSRGYFLDKVGASVRVGIELNLDFVTVKTITVKKYMSEVDRTFDLVTLLHTIEHIPYPVDFLKEAITKLSPGGTMIVEVPVDAKEGGFLSFPHLIGFQTWSMSTLAKRVGLKVIEMYRTPHLFTVLRRQDE